MGIDAINFFKEKLSKQEYIHQNRAKRYTKTLNFYLYLLALWSQG
ncbi:hypothetical protein UNSWCS_574 [Campylobacter concisus UNSWCS]|uniref:Uncharacterized protein n=1 Tax=Campylobacter concisus UNSWCS TaxID=1242968 RepID=U2F652_9BACT|nr:hypothetical protein UNSWCS_574 [Campylobacter concisus UNSWCS]